MKGALFALPLDPVVVMVTGCADTPAARIKTSQRKLLIYDGI